MGGGGDNKIEETAQQKALAEVSMNRWEDYLDDYRPFEDQYISEVNRMNTEPQYQQVANMAALPVESNFTQAVGQSSNNMIAQGINPNSGLFKAELEELDRNKAAVKSDMTNQSQVAQQGRYLSGLKNVVAMGQGQATESIQGMGDIASRSSKESYNSASNALQNRNANLKLAGTAIGAGTSYGLRSLETGTGNEGA